VHRRPTDEDPPLSLARIVAWNTAVQVGGRLVGLLASMAFTALLTRHLGLATYGQMVAGATYVAMFTILGDAGLYLVAVRRAAQEPERRAHLLGTALTLRLVLAFVALALAVLSVQFVPSRFPTYEPVLKLAVVLLAVNAYLTLLNQFLIAVFRLHLRMDLAVLGEVLARVVMLIATLLVVWLDGGLLAAVAAMGSGTLTNFLYGWAVSRRFEKFHPQVDVPLMRQLLAESMVLAVVTLLGLVHFKVDTLLLSVLRQPDEVGVYGVAYKVHEVLITFPGLFVGLLFPVFSRLATEDAARLQLVFQRAFDVLLMAGLGAALLVDVSAPQLAALLGAPAAATPMRILALALPAIFLSLGFTHLLMAEARQRWLVPLYLLLVLVNIGANWIFIRRYSYLGAAGVTVGTETLALVVLAGYWLGKRRWRIALRSLWAVPLGIGVAALGRVGEAHAPAVDSVPQRVGLLVASVGLALVLYGGAILALRLLPAATVRALLPTGMRVASRSHL
jgi:O-antigen/teichoic acid export membrane protein